MSLSCERVAEEESYLEKRKMCENLEKGLSINNQYDIRGMMNPNSLNPTHGCLTHNLIHEGICPLCPSMGRLEFIKNFDPVNNPPHYNNSEAKCTCGRRIECIDVTRHLSFNIGNAMKYLWRCELKGNTLEDLKKAAWYIQDEINKRSVHE